MLRSKKSENYGDIKLLHYFQESKIIDNIV